VIPPLSGLENVELVTTQIPHPVVPSLRSAEVPRNTQDVVVVPRPFGESVGGESLPDLPLADIPIPDVPLPEECRDCCIDEE
jgi:hypothetical protein